MLQLLLKFLKLLLIIYVFVFAYQWWRPMPEQIISPSLRYDVPDKSVHFLFDLEQTKNGNAGFGATIASQYQTLLKKAEHLVLIGESYVPETGSSTIRDVIFEKHRADKHVAIALVTDPISTRYGGINSETFSLLRENGVFVINTDMRAMPDGNLFYSSLWRPFFSWWGNSVFGGKFDDPIGLSNQKFTLRSWLAFLNIKMNESHFLLVDTKKGESKKITTLIMSSDLSLPRGSTGAVAVEVSDGIWKELLRKEVAVVNMSNTNLPSYASGDAVDETGPLHASLIEVNHINERLISLIQSMRQNDQLDIAARFVSDRAIIAALKDAANRNVHIRMILDPNEDLFGYRLYGMPNRPAAKELVGQTSNGILVRWCDSRLLPCESRLILGKTASSTFLITGGADLTRRDTKGYNIESEILIESQTEFTAAKDAEKYFNKLWANDGGSYTVDYQMFADKTLWRSSVYRMMERTGISLY